MMDWSHQLDKKIRNGRVFSIFLVQSSKILNYIIYLSSFLIKSLYKYTEYRLGGVTSDLALSSLTQLRSPLDLTVAALGLKETPSFYWERIGVLDLSNRRAISPK